MCFQRHLDLKQALTEHRKSTPSHLLTQKEGLYLFCTQNETQGTYLQDHSVERTFAQSDGEM